MHDEYISREAEIEAVKHAWAKGLEPSQYIEILPAADVTEVRHARWEEADWREYDAQRGETICFPKAAIVCSDCRNAFKKESLRIQSFCPACGAKMDGAAE